MKHRLFVIFVLAAVLLSAALPFSDVYAAGKPKTATLVDFRHAPSKGWTAIFKITGDWKESDLKGNSITVGDKTYNLYCNFRDEDHISCTMHHDMAQLVGKPAVFNFAGQATNEVVPPKRICNSWTSQWLWSEGDQYGEDGYYYPYGNGTALAAALEQSGIPYSYWHWYAYNEWGLFTYSDPSLLPESFIDLYYDYGPGYYEGNYGYYDYEWHELEYIMGLVYSQECSEEYYGENYFASEQLGWSEEAGYGECFGDECYVEDYYCDSENSEECDK